MTTITPTAPGIAPGTQLSEEHNATQCATAEMQASSCAEYARAGLTRPNPDLPHSEAVLEQVCRTANDSRGIATAPDSAPAFDQLIQSRFAGQSGWFCLGTIDGDPDLEKMKQEWYLLPRQRTELAERCAELAARGFNLYWAACLFDQRKRSYAAALPSCWLWQDDSPADMACTLLIQSSEHKYQALVKLDRPITARERQRLQVAWRDATPGADSCSGNAVQLGRMPGGYNRKRHAFFQVQVVSQTNTFWSADHLLAKAPQIAQKETGAITDLDWPAVEPHLTNIDLLLASGRAGCIDPKQQTGRILAGERVAIASAKLGRMDDSSSTQIAILAYGFYCRGFLDEEIAAVCMHFYRKWSVEARKGTAWCKADIERCIVLAHAKKPGVVQSPTRYNRLKPAAPIVATPAASRARADRPRIFDPAMLFARYQAQPELCDQRRKARAAALGISTATLDRLEDSLESLGLIEIQAPKGMPGRVILLGGVINISAPEVLSGQIEPPPLEVAPERTESNQNADRSPQCIGETHPPPVTPSPVAPRRSRVELVAEAFDALDGCKRLTENRIRQYIEMNYPEVSISPATLRVLAANERKRRRYTKQDAKETEKARKMRWSSLIKKSQNLGSQAAQMRRKGDKRAPVWERRAGIYAAEESRRIESGEAPTRLLRGRGVDIDEALILAEIDEQRRQQPAQQQGTGGRVCSPQPTPAMLQPDLFADAPEQPPRPLAPDGWSMIARLQKAATARQAVQHG